MQKLLEAEDISTFHLNQVLVANVNLMPWMKSKNTPKNSSCLLVLWNWFYDHYHATGNSDSVFVVFSVTKMYLLFYFSFCWIFFCLGPSIGLIVSCSGRAMGFFFMRKSVTCYDQTFPNVSEEKFSPVWWTSSLVPVLLGQLLTVLKHVSMSWIL